MMNLPFAIGLALSLAVALLAKSVGLDRDRAFYPTVLIVVGSYYVLFAAIGGSLDALLVESVLMAAVVVPAVLGFKGSQWIVVAGLIGHGVVDAIHRHVIDNAGVPQWWPAFCFAYDVGAGCWVAWFKIASAPRVAAAGQLARLAAMARQ